MPRGCPLPLPHHTQPAPRARKDARGGACVAAGALPHVCCSAICLHTRRLFRRGVPGAARHTLGHDNHGRPARGGRPPTTRSVAVGRHGQPRHPSGQCTDAPCVVFIPPPPCGRHEVAAEGPPGGSIERRYRVRRYAVSCLRSRRSSFRACHVRPCEGWRCNGRAWELRDPAGGALLLV